MASELAQAGSANRSENFAQKDALEAPGFSSEALPRALGRYILLRLIARGGMGEVYLASTTGLEGAERPVVVKVIRREHARDPSFLARFLDEARVQAQLQHPGVAQVVDAAMEEASGEPYVVVEYVEGRSLGDARARATQIGFRVGWAEAVALATMIAEALAHVHERYDVAGKPLSIVHRDLSPQNVMIGFSGELKLIDFGTARGQNRRCHTVAGVVFAKPGYVAPEVANGDSGDARVDLYALGIMLWEMCVGRRFLTGEAADHMAAVARNANNPPPIAASIGAPPELDAIIAKLTAFDREARYLPGRAAASDLAKLLASAPSLTTGERGIRARVAELMQALFPGEPMRSRREFARLVTAARVHRSTQKTPTSKAPASLAKAQRDEEAGRLPGTRYRIRREIGRGASSAVYEAEHADLGKRVALKVLALEHVSSKEFTARFRREARALSRLSHPNVVKVDDFGVATDGRLYSVMELLEGETLEAYLAREKGMDWRDALKIAEKTLAALEVVHAASIVHRDVKPANLFITKNGLKLLDFGLAMTPDEAAPAEAMEGDASKLAGLTLFGTPEYMAPEQATDGRVDARADLYAVGCVLYEMLTGRLPFADGSQVAILDAKIKGCPESLRERAPSRGIPASVDALVMRAMARHPSVRFQSAGEMLAAIEAALDAPIVRRSKWRLLGMSGLAASMAFAVVLLGGKAHEIRAMLSRHAATPAVAAADAAPSLADATQAPAAPRSIVDAPPSGAEAPTVLSPIAANDVVVTAPMAEIPAPMDADESDATDLKGADLATVKAPAQAPTKPAPAPRAASDRPHAPAAAPAPRHASSAPASSSAPAAPTTAHRSASASDAPPTAVASTTPAGDASTHAPTAPIVPPADTVEKPASTDKLEDVATDAKPLEASHKGHRTQGHGPGHHKRKHRVAATKP